MSKVTMALNSVTHKSDNTNETYVLIIPTTVRFPNKIVEFTSEITQRFLLKNSLAQSPHQR